MKNVPKDKISSCFEIVTPNRSYILQAGNKEQALEWITALENAKLLATGRATAEHLLDPGALITCIEHLGSKEAKVNNPVRGAGVVSPSSSSMEISGHLAKKSPGAVGGWKRRWFSLQSDGLLHYSETENTPVLGSIDLSLVRYRRKFTA